MRHEIGRTPTDLAAAVAVRTFKQTAANTAVLRQSILWHAAEILVRRLVLDLRPRDRVVVVHGAHNVLHPTARRVACLGVGGISLMRANALSHTGQLKLRRVLRG